MNNFILKKCFFLFFFIFSFFLFSPVVFSQNLIPLINQYKKETNFLFIQINEYKYSKNGGQVLIASSNNSETIYAAIRDAGAFDKIKISKNLDKLEVIEHIKIPTIKNADQVAASVYLLDIYVSPNDNILYLSTFNSFLDTSSCSKVIIYKFDSQKFSNIFESTPCIGRLQSFNDIAGRLASNDKYIFVSGGNVLSDLYNIDFPGKALCCFNDASYYELNNETNLFNSIVAIDKYRKNKYLKVAIGFRAPEGLFWDPIRSKLWESEHGPRGGDELNAIESGKDYGWPYVTLGADYFNRKKNYFQTKFNTHRGYKEPFFSWVPSIGVSQITQVNGGAFNNFWHSDLLVGSLKEHSIFRLRLLNDKVLYAERIEVGSRIRSLVSKSNSIVASSDNGSLFIIKPLKDQVWSTFPQVDYLEKKEGISKKDLISKTSIFLRLFKKKATQMFE